MDRLCTDLPTDSVDNFTSIFLIIKRKKTMTELGLSLADDVKQCFLE